MGQVNYRYELRNAEFNRIIPVLWWSLGKVHLFLPRPYGYLFTARGSLCCILQLKNMRKFAFWVIGLLVLFAPSGSRAQNFWEYAGGMFTDTIVGITAGSNGTIVLGTRGNQIYRSDGVSQWAQCQIAGSLGFLGGFASGAILIGDGQTFTGSVSFDNGATWRSTNQFYNGSFGKTDFLISAAVICVDHTMIEATQDGSIILSRDSGTSWIRMGDAPPYGAMNAMVMDKNGILLASPAEINNGGVYRSTDTGKHWMLMGVDSSYVIQLAIAPNGHLFAGVSTDILFNSGIYRSTDMGKSWSLITNGLPKNYYSIISDSVGDLYSSRFGGIYRSTDDGDSWSFSASGIPDSDGAILAVSSTGTIFAATDSYGVYRSTNHGNSWQAFNLGLPNVGVGVFSADSVGGMFAARSPRLGTAGGLWLSKDNGSSWKTINSFTIDEMAAIPNGDVFLAEINENGNAAPDLQRWDHKGNFINDVTPPTDIGEISVATTSFGCILATTNHGTFFSSDTGAHWTEENSVGEGSLSISPTGIVVSDGVACSTDEGKTWTYTNTGTYPGTVECVAFNIHGEIFSASEGIIYRSTDSGRSWQVTISGIIGSVNAIVGTRTGVLFASTHQGVFRSFSDGDFWSPVSSGLTANSFGEMAVSNDGTLFISTDVGIFRSTASVLGVSGSENSPTPIILVQNSPNPFTQSTNISFTLNEPSFITLKLFNPLGSEVAALANGFLDAGEHAITFDRGDLPDGVYFYRLEAGSEALTRSFVVLR
jgi:photosystem II stability/assembly factor-like uncharacterized protein